MSTTSYAETRTQSTDDSAGSAEHRARPPRIRSLARAELRQFTRNRTLVVMALALPLLIPVGMLVLAKRSDDLGSSAVVSTLEVFALYTLVFVVFYTLVSMVTTRRDERVLKRLRTGEATDLEIVVAMAMPALLLVVILTGLVLGVVAAMGGGAPASPLPLVVALVGGTVIFIALAFATSTFTKNAEATQITSLPVVMLAVVGMSNLRGLLPDGPIAEAAALTPMAAVSDLLHWGWTATAPGSAADAPAEPLTEVLAAMAEPTAVLAGWVVVAVVIARAYFRWDPRG